jgi:TolB-like protein/class 3 adenylate cyclase/Tfp pilus assembly protein PilF
MPSDAPSEVKFEIGHVLFIDIVGYSKLLITEQTEQIQKLKKIVRGTEQVRLAEAEGKLLRLPTGDGGALVFRNSPEAPVLCALEIAKALKNHPELKVRMGIHSGPVNEITDLNEQANIAGAGINIAQRVMDCGDAGHILLSKHVADDLEHYPRWQPFLQELGECEVKHGVRVGVVNFHGGEVGNRQVPKKFRSLQKQRARMRWSMLVAAILLLAVVVAAFLFALHRPAQTMSAIAEKSVAVLPFENLSTDKANAYFADGIQDQILTKLASIADLKVISRTSTATYKSKPEDLKAVSQQLGVATVVEGTVQRAAERVRVNVQLIDARADTHLWAKTYDRDMKDIFAVESEVSQEIADTLKAKLSPNEATTLAAAPTRDPIAYDLFFKAEFEQREAESSLKLESYDQAENWYRQAIAHDPDFALAIARLARSQMNRHWLVQRLTEPQLEDAKRIAERALALAPNLAQAHIALGTVHYFGHRHYDEALAEFRKALQLEPNDTEAAEMSAFVHRRQGQWQKCLSEILRSKEKDPLNPNFLTDIGTTFLQLRMWKEANEAAAHTLELNPHDVRSMRVSLASWRNGSGDISEGKRLLLTLPQNTDLTFSQRAGVVPLVGERAYLSILEGNFEAALEVWQNEGNDPIEMRKRFCARTAIRVLAGQHTGGLPEAERATQLLNNWLRDRPNDEVALADLSWIVLALGHPADAIKLAQQAADLLPLEKDPFVGTSTLVNLAEIQARCGRSEEAIKILQRLLSIPAGFDVSIVRLKIDPVWDPIRNDAGFQQLLNMKEHIGP